MLERRFEDYHAEQMKDPEYRREWESLQGELEEELERLKAELAKEETSQPVTQYGEAAKLAG